MIEVTRLFTGDIQEFSARQALGATGMDANRSFIEHVTALSQQYGSRGYAHLYARRGGRGGADGGGAAVVAAEAAERNRGAASQHGEIARHADAAAAVR